MDRRKNIDATHIWQADIECYEIILRLQGQSEGILSTGRHINGFTTLLFHYCSKRLPYLRLVIHN